VTIDWRLREKILRSSLAIPALVLVALFWLAPLIILFAYSFFTNIMGGGFVPDFTVANYVEIFTDPFYFSILLRTVFIAIAVTVLAIIVGFPVSYKLSRLSPQKASFLLTLIIVPFLTAVVFRTYGLIYIMGNKGVINSFLKSIGLGGIKLIWNRTGVILGFLNVLLPYMILSLYSSLTQVDKSLEEAAGTLGANKLRVIWHVTLPMIKSGIATGSIFVFAIAMGTFVVPSVLGGSREIVMSMLIQQNVARINYPGACAIAIVLLILVVGTVGLLVKLLGGEIKF